MFRWHQQARRGGPDPTQLVLFQLVLRQVLCLAPVGCFMLSMSFYEAFTNVQAADMSFILQRTACQAASLLREGSEWKQVGVNFG